MNAPTCDRGSTGWCTADKKTRSERNLGFSFLRISRGLFPLSGTREITCHSNSSTCGGNMLTLRLQNSHLNQSRRRLPCCRTAARWDNCSVRRSRPGSQSTHCPNSPSCSCTPSFLQFRCLIRCVCVLFFLLLFSIRIGEKGNALDFFFNH